MLCDEHGLFLDIAQAIRRLQLTILKGVMETRSSNMWAHFVVEVYCLYNNSIWQKGPSMVLVVSYSFGEVPLWSV